MPAPPHAAHRRHGQLVRVDPARHTTWYRRLSIRSAPACPSGLLRSGMSIRWQCPGRRLAPRGSGNGERVERLSARSPRYKCDSHEIGKIRTHWVRIFAVSGLGAGQPGSVGSGRSMDRSDQATRNRLCPGVDLRPVPEVAVPPTHHPHDRSAARGKVFLPHDAAEQVCVPGADGCLVGCECLGSLTHRIAALRSGRASAPGIPTLKSHTGIVRSSAAWVMTRFAASGGQA